MAKIKGTALLGIVRALRSRRAEAMERLPPSLHHYLSERVVIVSWYPEEEYVELLQAYADMAFQGRGWERIGEMAAAETLSSVYKNLVRDGDVAATVRQFPAAWRNYHDSGTLTATLEAGVVRVEVRNHPIVHRGACRLNQAYFGALLRRAGGRLASNRASSCTAEGGESCVWELVLGPELPTG